MPFTVSSPNYGLAEQVANPWVGNCVTLAGPENKDARKWYVDNNIACFAYSALARGFFSGAFGSNEPEKAKGILDEAGIKGYFCERNLERLRRAEILAREKGVSVAQVALAFIFSSPMNTFLLTSPINEKQIKENVAAEEIKLTEEETLWLDLEK